jgi:hypothetical protein
LPPQKLQRRRGLPSREVVVEPKPARKRKRGLREVVFESPGAAHAAVTSDTPVARRTRAGRAAAAARAAVAPPPPPAPVKPHADDDAEGQEPPRKKPKKEGPAAAGIPIKVDKIDDVRALLPDIRRPLPADQQREEEEQAAGRGAGWVPPSADVWRVAGPADVVRMRLHPQKYHELRLAEGAPAGAAGRARKGGRALPAQPGEEGAAAAAAVGQPRLTRSRAAAAAAVAAAPAAERKGEEKKEEKGKERAAPAAAAPAVVAGPFVAARGPRGGGGDEGVRYAGYEWRRLKEGRSWVWEGR